MADAASSGAAVLFDWNGTVVDDRTRAWESVNAVLADADLRLLSESEWAEAWCLPLTDHMVRIGIDPSRAEAAVVQWNAEVARREAPLSRGARLLLEGLVQRQVHISVVTAASPVALAGDLDMHELSETFASIHTDTVDKAAVIAAAGANREAVIYVGDSELDMAHGKAAGAFTVGFTGGYCTAGQLAAAGADLLVDDLADVLELPLIPGAHA